MTGPWVGFLSPSPRAGGMMDAERTEVVSLSRAEPWACLE